MTAVFWRYPRGPLALDSIDRHQHVRIAAKALRPGLEDLQQRLEDRLNDEVTEDGCCNADNRTENEAVVVPQKLSRRLQLHTSQPLNVRPIMVADRLYIKESKALEAAQDMVLSFMLGLAEFADEDFPPLKELAQELNTWQKETRRYVLLPMQLRVKDVG